MIRFIKDNWFKKYYRKDGIRETSITMIAASSIDWGYCLKKNKYNKLEEH